MSNRVLPAVVALLLISVAPASVVAQSGGPIAPGVAEQQDWLRGYDVPDDAITHGPTANPTWVVTVTNGTGPLASWADESTDRALVRTTGENRAVVAASPAAIGVTQLQQWLGNGLATKSYVERISPNRALSLAEPVSTASIPTAENATTPSAYGPAGIESLARTPWPAEGIAYRDSTNVTTAGEGRDVIGADNVSADGSGLTVAVIDSGFDTANGTLGVQDNLLNASKDFVESNSSYNDTVGNNGVDAVADPNGHGSWVGSTIVNDPNSSTTDETYEGVAPAADLLALRVLDSDGSGSTANIAASIRYAEAHGADVLSMSLGSQLYTPEVAAALRDACAGNVTVATVAAGNSRERGSPYLASPSDVPGACVVSVAASNTSSAETAGIASFSQLGNDPGADTSGGVTRGQDIDLAAPGMLIEQRVADADNTTDKVVLSGTSMAQPYVAGSALLVLDAEPTLVNDSAGLKERLTSTARRVPNAATVETGHGLVAPDRAIAGNETEQSQTDAMTDAARVRDEFWSEAGSEGLLARAAEAVGV